MSDQPTTTTTTTAPAETVGELMSDPTFKEAWLNSDHPGHAAAVARKSRAVANPEPAAPFARTDVEGALHEQAARGFAPDTQRALAGTYEPPASAEEYSFRLPIPDGAHPAQVAEDLQKARAIAHAVGVPDGLAETFVGLVEQAQRKPMAPGDVAAAGEAVEAKLRAEMGDDAFEARLAAARVLVARGGPILQKVLADTGLVNNEFVIRRLMNLAEARGFVPKP